MSNTIVLKCPFVLACEDELGLNLLMYKSYYCHWKSIALELLCTSIHFIFNNVYGRGCGSTLCKTMGFVLGRSLIVS